MRVILLTVLFVIVDLSVAIAQPGLPSNPTQVPVDGGLGLLAAAGGSYAWYKLRQRKSED
jgi:drug/metabolite transporter (DMT)-like permease